MQRTNGGTDMAKETKEMCKIYFEALNFMGG